MLRYFKDITDMGLFYSNDSKSNSIQMQVIYHILVMLNHRQDIYSHVVVQQFHGSM